jgi:hypothetical protein
MPDEVDAPEVLRVLRALLEAVDQGEMTALSRKEQGAVRQLRGAVAALEALTGKPGGPPTAPSVGPVEP